MKNKIIDSLKIAQSTITNFINDNKNIEQIDEISNLIATTFTKGNKIIISGNGGSAADAMHFAEEFTGRFRNDRRALPVIAIPDSTHLTCVGNDYGFDKIFSRQIQAFAKQNDIFIGISTSGNSQNIIEALKVAKENKMITLGFLGKNGGNLQGLFDHEIIIPGETTDRIQEMHMMIFHIIIEMTERKMFPKNYQQ